LQGIERLILEEQAEFYSDKIRAKNQKLCRCWAINAARWNWQCKKLNVKFFEKDSKKNIFGGGGKNLKAQNLVH
jgi:hypothetical protein